jgi:hypothetical protein
MAVSDLSPNVDNYYIGKGIVKWKADGDPDFRDVGNAPLFEVTISVTKLDHFSSRQGIRFKDRSIVTEVNATVKMTLEEITSDNLLLALLGDKNAGPPIVIDIGTNTELTGALRFIGTNDVGMRMQIDLPSVLITPDTAISPISDGWGSIGVAGDINADLVTGSFGTVTTNITDEVT